MSAELEYSLAATVCLEPKTVLKLRQIVTVDDFSIPACAQVFDAANSAVSRGKQFDANIAADELRGSVDDPRRFLAECIEVTPTTANAEEWAELLHRHAAEKRLREGVLLALNGDSQDRRFWSVPVLSYSCSFFHPPWCVEIDYQVHKLRCQLKAAEQRHNQL